MNPEDVVKIADEIVSIKTGQHLDDLQEAILRGTLQRDKYKKIANDLGYSESRVREVGSQLWRILSEELEENINKLNLKSAMERLQNSHILNFGQDVVVSDSFNICGKNQHLAGISNLPARNEETADSKQTEALHQDLSEMPELCTFYDRTSALDTLTTWILQQRCRLIALTGMPGIGKTALAVQLVQRIKDEFEYVIWCNLDESYSLDELQHKLIQFFQL
uniref:NB-ARC domain-containing protein n=1 Tax=Desertifilum tharense IPPAS B-1220 TaxID=1781255 RepID=A0ACD5GNW5_9CYAN